MPTQKATAPVSMRALIQRVNRKLAADDEVLKAARGARAVQDLGYHYIVDSKHNLVLHKDVDVEHLGRELGVLRAYERVVLDEAEVQ
jgi:hypothetical protein